MESQDSSSDNSAADQAKSQDSSSVDPDSALTQSDNAFASSSSLESDNQIAVTASAQDGASNTHSVTFIVGDDAVFSDTNLATTTTDEGTATTIEVADGDCLSTSQIPSVSSAAGFEDLAFESWDTVDFSASYTSTQLAQLPITDDLTLYATMGDAQTNSDARAASGTGTATVEQRNKATGQFAVGSYTLQDFITYASLYTSPVYESLLGGLALDTDVTLSDSSYKVTQTAASTSTNLNPFDKLYTLASGHTGDAPTLTFANGTLAAAPTSLTSTGDWAPTTTFSDIGVSLTSGTKMSSGVGTLSYENCTVNLTGSSSITADAGGTVAFKDCTIVLDGTSSLANNGTMTFDNCKITYADGSSAISSSGTMSFTNGCTVDGGGSASVERTTPAITVTGGTCTVTSTTIQNVTNTSTVNDTAGGAFCLTGGVLNLESGTISNCKANADLSNGGGSAVYAAGGTVNLTGMTVSGCGYGSSIDEARKYYTSPFVLNGGNMTMSGGAITGNASSHGGAVSVVNGSSSFSMTGGTISNNSAYYDGGGVFVSSGIASISGGTISSNTAGRNGCAIGTRSGSTLNLSGGTITGNNTTGAVTTGSSTVGAVSGFSGGNCATVNLSGSPTISGNTYGTGTDAVASDLAVYSTTTVRVGALDSTANVGITSVNKSLLADGAQFATSTGSTDNLSHLFNDSNYSLLGTAGSGTAVVWGANQYVCKIVDPVTGVATGYTTLQAAIDSIPDNGSAKIEMLVETYQPTATVSIKAGKNVTLTKASETAADGLPYRGTAGSIPSIKRSSSVGIVMGVTEASSLSVTDLSFTSDSTYAASAEFIYAAGSGVSVTLGENVTLKGIYGYQGAAMKIWNGATVTMESNSTITECSGRDAGVVDMQGGSTLIMKDTSSIKNCTGDNASSAIFMRNSAANYLVMTDDATISNNTCGGHSGEAATISGHGGSSVITMSGNASVSNNTVTGTRTTTDGNTIAGGIRLRGSSTLSISGSASITGNTTPDSADAGAGVNAIETAAKVKIEGSPTITGNIAGGSTETNVKVLDTSSSIVVTGDLTGGEVGVYCTNRNTVTSQFGTTTASKAVSVSGLQHITCDADGTLFGMAKDSTTNAVVWGKGTCQIIRGGEFIGTYNTLAEACAAAITGDTIQVFRSHALTSTATLNSGVTDVTVETAPLTQTVDKAFAFLPNSDETSTASVTRDSSLTSGALLDIASTGDTVSNLIFNGASVTSSAPAVQVDESATFSNVTVTKCVTSDNKGAVNVANGKQLSVAGTMKISDNVNESNLASNLKLETVNTDKANTSVVKILGDLDASSSIGISVASDADHASYIPFAQGCTAEGTADTTVAANSVQRFFDDYHPTLNIGANEKTSGDGLGTYLYFQPPTAFSFYKVSDNLENDPIEGAEFSIYQWTGSQVDYENNKSEYNVFLTAAELENDVNWEPVTEEGSTTAKVVTSDANGLVDFGDANSGGGLRDGIFRLVEVNTPTNYKDITSLGGWQFIMDSTKADPGKVYVPSGWSNPLLKTSTTTGVYAGEQDATTHVWSIKNAYETATAQLKVYKTTEGDYADKTKAFGFTATVVGTEGGTYTGTVMNADGTSSGTTVSIASGTEFSFSLYDGQYLEVDALPVGATYTVAEDGVSGGKAEGYSVGITADEQNETTPSPAVDTDTGTVSKAASGMGQGETRIDFTNTYTSPVPSGIDDGLGWVWWMVVIAAILGAVAAISWRRNRKKRIS